MKRENEEHRIAHSNMLIIESFVMGGALLATLVNGFIWDHRIKNQKNNAFWECA